MPVWSNQTCIMALTHRQFTVLQVWLEGEWNQPSRTDHYLMQIARDVRQLFSKTPITLASLKIPFIWRKKGTPKLTRAQLEMDKAIWMGMIGAKDGD